MTEKGWFHPSIGYWQTTGRVSKETQVGFPKGTVEVTVKPGGGYALDEKSLTWVEEALDPDVRLQLAKAECRLRIYGVVSAETQMNINAAVSAVAVKAASARSGSDKDLLSDASILNGWVGEMRSRVSTIAADDTLDMRADESWPVCPPKAMKLIASF